MIVNQMTTIKLTKLKKKAWIAMHTGLKGKCPDGCPLHPPKPKAAPFEPMTFPPRGAEPRTISKLRARMVSGGAVEMNRRKH